VGFGIKTSKVACVYGLPGAEVLKEVRIHFVLEYIVRSNSTYSRKIRRHAGLERLYPLKDFAALLKKGKLEWLLLSRDLDYL
jgi:hypothetical protein